MKNTTRNKINLVFSSFLVIGYVICTYFFSQLADQVGGGVGNLIRSLILVLFGLLLFYATRVGEGKQVRRFSIAVLLLLVVPCIYIIAASFASFLPFHDQLAPVTAVADGAKSAQFQPLILMLACIGLGYGVPYTFLAGYEIDAPKDDAEPEEAEADEPVEEVEAQPEAEAEAPAEDAPADEPAEEAEKKADEETAGEKPAEEPSEAEA